MTLPIWANECLRLGMMSTEDIEMALADGWTQAEIEAATERTRGGFSLAQVLAYQRYKAARQP